MLVFRRLHCFNARWFHRNNYLVELDKEYRMDQAEYEQLAQKREKRKLETKNPDQQELRRSERIRNQNIKASNYY